MFVEIIRINQNDDEYPIVEFITSIGLGKGFWRSGPLERLGHYDVELDFEDEIFWGLTIYEVKSKETYIKIDGDYTIIQGQLESIDKDNTFVIRLGKAIVFCEAKGTPPLPGTFVRVKLQKVSLYDTHSLNS